MLGGARDKMANREGWERLRDLLMKPTWDKRQAIFIVAGLDPATEWLTPDAPLKWLPGGLLPEWVAMTSEQVWRRAERAVGTADRKLLGLPSPMTPFAWLCEAMHRKEMQPHPLIKSYIHAGIAPPWLKGVLNRPEFKSLVPPLLYPQSDAAKTKHAQTPDAARRAVARAMWDAWNVAESDYPTKAAFIAAVLMELDKQAGDAITDEGLVRAWVDDWERGMMTPYGRIEPEAGRQIRTYGPHAIMEPIKRLNPK